MTLPDLPAGWYWTTVEQAGRLQLGRQRAPKHHEGPHMRPYLRVANVFEDRIDKSDVMSMNFEPEEFERYRLHPGDILLNEGQTPDLLGRPAMYEGGPADCAFTNSLIRFQAGVGVLPGWALLVFRAHMHSGRFKRESRITTNIAHLSAARLKGVEFPVPPLDKQRQLVSELAVSEGFLRSVEVQLGALRRRNESLLTRTLIELTTPAADWRATTLAEESLAVRNGVFVSRPGSLPDGVAILRIGAVRPMRLRLDDLRYTGWSSEDDRVASHLLAAGDLLFTRYNGNPDFVGACAVVPELGVPVTHPDKLIRVCLRPDRCAPLFLAAVCSVGPARAHIAQNIKTSAGQTGISGTDIKNIPLRLPDLAQQERLAVQVRSALEAHAQHVAGIGRIDGLLRGLKRALLLRTVDPQRFQ